MSETMAYLQDGQEVEVVERIASGVVIRRIFDYGDEDSGTGDPEIVGRVFDVPPVERKAKVICDLEACEAALRERIAELQRQVHEREAAESKIAAFKNQDAALARISDFLAGRVTHYVLNSQYGSVDLVAAAPGGGIPYEEDGKRYVRETKLMSLFGESGKDLQWKVNRYSDGSGGGWTDAEPFTCLEDATARLQELIEGWESEKDYPRGRLYDSALKHGIPIPAGFQAWFTAAKVVAALREVADTQAKLETADAKLKAAREAGGH